MKILGIDPGLNGGIASLDFEKGLKLFLTPTIGGRDYDIQAIKTILLQEQPNFVLIETQIALPGQGLSSTLQTGKGFGILLGLLAGMEIPHQVIGAKQWQIKMFTGVSGKLETKEKSEIIAKRLFPKADFRRSERAFKAHDGLTDAACIAEYGRRTSNSASERVSGVPHTTLPDNPDICVICGGFVPSLLENNCIK